MSEQPALAASQAAPALIKQTWLEYSELERVHAQRPAPLQRKTEERTALHARMGHGELQDAAQIKPG